MAREPITAIRHQVAVSLEGLSWPVAVEVYRGWVEGERFVAPSISVVAGRPQRQPDVAELRREDVDAELDIFWRIETLEVPVTLIAYTDTKTERRDLAGVMDEWLHPGPADNRSEPPSGRRTITLASHHDAPCEIIHEDDAQPDDEGRGEGLWRAEWSLTCRCPKIRKQRYDKASWTGNVEMVDSL
mgnify:CR=1 FL=1